MMKVTPAPTSPSLAESFFPRLGAIAACGVALMTSACASTRQVAPIPATPHVAPLDPAASARNQARQQARLEFSQASEVAKSLGITGYVFVASNGQDFSSLEKVHELSGTNDQFNNGDVRMVHNGESVTFKLGAFKQWQTEQVQALVQRNLTGALIGLDGRVVLVATPRIPVERVEPFRIAANQR